MLDWTWSLTIASIVGVIANNYRKRWCFYIWSITNASWAIVDYQAGLQSQSVLFVIYFFLAIHGLRQWRTKDEPRNRRTSSL